MAFIFDGRAVAGTDNVISWKGHGLTFTPEDPNCYPRKVHELTMGVLHWTGGEGDYKQVYTTLRKRKLGIHFFVDYHGTVYQFCDPARVVTPHAGAVNQFAYGIEVQNRAFQAEDPKVEARLSKRAPRGLVRQVIHGQQQSVLTFSEEQVSAVVLLVERFAALGVHPRRAKAGSDVMPTFKRSAFSGVLGHMHVSSAKLDPGLQLFEELELDGWKLV